jgi:hypothetical protein
MIDGEMCVKIEGVRKYLRVSMWKMEGKDEVESFLGNSEKGRY